MADNKNTQKKYNLSVIMRRAWKIYRENNGKLSWSDCLKQSWSIAKNGINANDFNGIYKEFHGMVFYYVHGKIFNGNSLEVEEIVNDVFTKVYQNLANYDYTKAKLNTWIINIAKNCIIDLSRSKQYKKSSQVDLIDGYKDESGNETYQINAHDLNGQERLENKELGNRLNNAFNGLSEKYREVAKMALIEKMSIKEISTVLDKPENTVKVQIMRAKEMLREKLQGVY
jgi:RNA polymerase sigma-70 factor (ECF subfamily)